MSAVLTVVRNTPDWVAYFDDERAARLYGSEYRVQRLYFYSREEAEAFAKTHTLNGGPVRIESCT